jgi:hypothetical protein
MNMSRLPNVVYLNPQLSFNVVIAYEDFSTGTHALNVCNRIFPGCSKPPSFSTHNVWRFDLLEIAKFRDLAATKAANADMIIISARAPGELPTAVKRWIELWAKKRKNEPGALVVLLAGAKKRGTADLRAEAYLQDCAARAGMDIFIQREKARHGLPAEDGADFEDSLLPPALLEKMITGVPWREEYN